MAFIGNTPTTQAFTPAIDYFSGNGSTTAFTLSRQVASVAQVQVTIDNVAQNPSSAYTVSANTITFTSAPLSGTNNIYVYYTSPITQVIAPGQGTVGLTQLNATGTPSSSNFLRGDNAWSTLSRANMPAGSVLQVVSTTKTDVFSTSAAGFVDITGLSVSITPTSATSKILVQFVVAVGVASGNTLINLVRGSTNIAQSTSGTANQTIAANLSAAYNMQTLPANFFDSPATTSATTYKVQIYPSASLVYVNVRATDNYYGGVSTITAMEIAA
jgi:hypothetical protein